MSSNLVTVSVLAAITERAILDGIQDLRAKRGPKIEALFNHLGTLPFGAKLTKGAAKELFDVSDGEFYAVASHFASEEGYEFVAKGRFAGIWNGPAPEAQDPKLAGQNAAQKVAERAREATIAEFAAKMGFSVEDVRAQLAKAPEVATEEVATA